MTLLYFPDRKNGYIWSKLDQKYMYFITCDFYYSSTLSCQRCPLLPIEGKPLCTMHCGHTVVRLCVACVYHRSAGVDNVPFSLETFTYAHESKDICMPRCMMHRRHTGFVRALVPRSVRS